MKRDISYIEKIYCAVRGIEPESLHTRTRKRDTVEARQVIMKLAEDYGNSIGSSADYFNLDRTTGIHARKHADNLTDTDKCLREEVDIMRFILDSEDTYRSWLYGNKTRKIYFKAVEI